MKMAAPEPRAIEAFLRDQTTAERVRVEFAPGAHRGARWDLNASFEGGACSGALDLVLVVAATGGVAVSHAFALRQAAFAAGVSTPEPLWLDAIGRDLGVPGFFTRRIPGRSHMGSNLSDLATEAGDRLVFRVGQALARLHAIKMAKPPATLDFLPVPGVDWVARHALAMRRLLDDCGAGEPVFEWAIRWIVDHAPEIGSHVLVHGDWHSSNLMIEGESFVGIDGFDDAHWSDPMEDLGCFCARYWRSSGHDREAGGIGGRQALYGGYREQSGSAIDGRGVAFWEIFATLRAGIAARAGTGANTDARFLPGELRRLRAIEAQYDLLLDIAKFDTEAP